VCGAGGNVRAAAAGDDVLGGAAKEQAADQVEPRVEVEVHRQRGEQDDREPERRELDRGDAAGDSECAVKRVSEWVLRVDVGRLNLGSAAALAEAVGEVVAGAPLGVGAGTPALERAQAADEGHALADVHEGGIIAANDPPDADHYELAWSAKAASESSVNTPVRRVGFEPTCPCGQRLLRPSCQPVAAPPQHIIEPTVAGPSSV
jgi:hypothetical protein